MTPDEYCQDKAAHSGSSFYYSFIFLPQKQRRAITALYAYCREVDDVVDNISDPQVAAAKLQWWRTEIDALYRGQAQHPVTRALATVLDDFDLPEEQLEEILDGMGMDLQQNLSRPSSSRTFFESSPSATLSLYSSHSWPIGLPHEKHLIGIIMVFMT